MTRMLEELGLREGQVFNVRVFGGDPWTLRFWNNTLWKKTTDGWEEVSAFFVIWLHGHPEVIETHPLLSMKQREALRSVRHYLGLKWIARDSDGIIRGFEHKPFKSMAVWVPTASSNNENGACAWLTSVKELETLVSWEDEEPFDIDRVLCYDVEKGND